MNIPIGRWGRLLLQPAFRKQQREWNRLRRLPRYTPTQTTLLGRPIHLVDPVSFRSMYRDIIRRQIYRFETDVASPFIIDGGANVGISTVFFKQLYPDSRILAFEPDETVFRALTHNVEAFGFTGVQLVQKALWKEETTLDFVPEGGDSGRLKRTTDHGESIRVLTARLRDFLTEPVHFLKLDIEGAEAEVLRDCADRLDRVERLFVEYHSFAGEPQRLDEILRILRDAGFRYDLERIGVLSPHPFVRTETVAGMDVNLNIYALRQAHQ